MDTQLPLMKFSALPPELRNQIWTLVCFHPRNIDLDTKELNYPTETRKALPCLFRYTSRTPAPSVLHVCRESREIGLLHYSLSFGTNQLRTHSRIGVEARFTAEPRVYINQECDLLRPVFLTGPGGLSKGTYFLIGCWDDFVKQKPRHVALAACSIADWMTDKSGRQPRLAAEEVLIYWAAWDHFEDPLEEGPIFQMPLPETKRKEEQPYEFLSLEEDIDEKLVKFEAPPEAKDELLQAKEVAERIFPDSVVKLGFRMTMKVKKRLAVKEPSAMAILGPIPAPINSADDQR